MRHKRVYAALKSVGFSAVKALEIVWDARRGDFHAMRFVHIACRQYRRKQWQWHV